MLSETLIKLFNRDLNRLKVEIESYNDENKNNTMMTNEDLMKTIFPPDKLDEFGQQLDLRHNNSWMLNLENTPIKELAEVFIINAIAPFILCKHLKEVMGYKSYKNDDRSWLFLHYIFSLGLAFYAF